MSWHVSTAVECLPLSDDTYVTSVKLQLVEVETENLMENLSRYVIILMYLFQKRFVHFMRIQTNIPSC